MEAALLPDVPAVVRTRHHLNSTSTKIFPPTERLTGILADDQGAKIWETKYLIKAQDREVWRLRSIAKVKRRGRDQSSSIEERIDAIVV